jgi:polyhydroxyalkanoate synthesis regulator phasin
MDHFFAKIAGVEDAPNYGPTAGDDRCETCSYFRATNDGVGYCERFSFEAEPESVCDDFVAAGRMKTSSAPSVYSRLTRFAKSPTGRRVGASMAAGAVSGAGVGAFGAGEERAMEALKGAIVGAAVGGLIGGIGPLARKNFSATEQKLLKEADEINRLNGELGSIMAEMRLAAGQARSKEGDRVVFRMERNFNRFYQERENLLKKYPGTTAAEKIDAVKKMIVDLQKKQQVSKSESYGAPSLSALVSGGLGFGLSHGSKEQEKYRRSKK